MKRALLAVPVVLFLFIYACVPSAPPIPLPIGTAVALTQTALVWTPTFTSTPSKFDSLSVLRTLGAPLPEDGWLKNVQELEAEFGASYDIVDARLMPASNLPNRILEIEVTCFCNARFRDCCSPERTFAIVMRRMEYHYQSVLWMVPDTVAELKVYCMDHDNQKGTMSARWSDVVDYLYGRISAKQFGNRVRPE